MANPQHLSKRHKQQQRLAWLAMLADHSLSPEQCLSDQTMAALVEGNLTPQEKESALTHLAVCDQCTSLWVQLDHIRQSQQHPQAKNRVTRLFSRPKVLAAVGSVLAVAASIAVFVTIALQPGKHTLHLFFDPVKQEAAPPSPKEAPSTEPEMIAPASPVLEKPHGIEPRRESEDKAEKFEQLQEMGKQIHSFASSANRTVPRSAPPQQVTVAPQKNTDQEQQQFGAKSALDTSIADLSLEHWLQMIREGCQPQQRTDFFPAALRYGRQLLAPTSSVALSPVLREKLETILKELENRKNRSPHDRCLAMLKVIDQLEQAHTLKPEPR
nr:hypothetical protein [uncultured Desulfobulbus sp.]